MEIRHLWYFKRVAELEHLTKAANELFVSQSYLSHVISEMESEMDVKLFDRVGRGIALNPCGREFYREVVRLFYLYEDAKKKAADTYRRHSGQLTLITNVSTYMPALLGAAGVALPDVSIRQLSAKRRKIVRTLLDGDADFGICCPILTEEPEVESCLLHTECGVIIYPQGHWLESREKIAMEELKGERFISVDAGYGTRDAQDAYLQRKHITVNNVIETSDTSSIFGYVDCGLGIAFAPITMTKQHPAFKGKYIQIEDEPTATIGLSWRKGHYFSETGKLFVETTKSFYNNLK